MEDGPVNVEVSSSSSQRNTKNSSIEDIADDYFSSVSSIARKLITEKQEKKGELKKNWDILNQTEKDKVFNEWFIDDGIRLRYEIRMQGVSSMPSTESIFEAYPKLKVPCGAKTVQYTDSNQTSQVITWRDEFSAPFSWDTKCQQNLGLFEDEAPSVLDTSDSNLNSSQISTDLDSSELFSRVKDKSNRLSNEDINIHINPTFNLEPKQTVGSATNSQANDKRKSQTVVTQPKAAPKPINHQINKPAATNGGASPPMLKPKQPPPAAPGHVVKRTTRSSSHTSQSSISSRSSYSSTSSSRPCQPPPSKPPSIVPKPSQPQPSAVGTRRPADTPPPPPPPATNTQRSPKVSQRSPKVSQRSPKVSQRFSPQNQSPESTILRKPVDKESKEEKPLSKALDDLDLKRDLDMPAARDSTEDDLTTTGKDASEEDEKVDTHTDAAFDFLLQW